MKHVGPRIITTHVLPPIPIRQFDWCAYYDGDEEGGPHGWGATEWAAVSDLREMTADYPRRCTTNLVAPESGECLHCHAANGERCREVCASATAPRRANRKGNAMSKKQARYDARYGWQYMNHAGMWCGCPPPFVTHKQAVDYALARLNATDDSPYAVIVDARAALEWAASL